MYKINGNKSRNESKQMNMTYKYLRILNFIQSVFKPRWANCDEFLF